MPAAKDPRLRKALDTLFACAFLDFPFRMIGLSGPWSAVDLVTEPLESRFSNSPQQCDSIGTVLWLIHKIPSKYDRLWYTCSNCIWADGSDKSLPVNRMFG